MLTLTQVVINYSTRINICIFDNLDAITLTLWQPAYDIFVLRFRPISYLKRMLHHVFTDNPRMHFVMCMCAYMLAW